jgi:organic hydroperoxide reductase OsmC/OhrA
MAWAMLESNTSSLFVFNRRALIEVSHCMRHRTYTLRSVTKYARQYLCQDRRAARKDAMKNLSILLEDRPGSLAAMGETLGRAGVSIEGGGMFVVDGKGVANFLVEDGTAGRRALEDAGLRRVREEDVVLLKLNQEEPGQLGQLLRRMAEAGVNILTQYSDHNHQLVLVVDELRVAQSVSDRWMAERSMPTKSDMSGASPTKRFHHYAVQVTWTGNTGSGTASYAGYERAHTISAAGKATINGSSDPSFRGDGRRYNPEEMLVASASACHMLTYLHLCAANKIVVTSYEDRPTGEMEESAGSGEFVRVDLKPCVTITAGSDVKRAKALHDEAHNQCFIANSLKIAVIVEPTIHCQGRE